MQSQRLGQMSRQISAGGVDKTVGVDKKAGVPVYQQLIELIGKQIRQNYRIGDFLMPEVELADQYKVNRHTIRRALDELVKLGIIVRKPGKGTMVVSSPIDYQITNSTRFTSTLEEQGYDTQSRLLKKYTELANNEVRQRLGLADEEQVVVIKTLRHVAETPVCVITQYLSLRHFAKLTSVYRRGSVQGFLQRHYQIELQRQDSFVTAVMPSAEQCQHLHISRSIPLLCIKTVNCNRDSGQPVEYSVSHNRSDCLQLQFSTRDKHVFSGVNP